MRVFVAIEISNIEIIESIKKIQEKIIVNAKPTKTENLHFTIQFLGEISEEKLSQIDKALHTIEFSSFDIDLKGIGAFPGNKSPRVIWIGIDNENGKKMLNHLAKKVEKVLIPLGFSVEKSLKPHITIFRIKKKIGDITMELEKYKMTEFGVQKVTSIKLKKSELTSNGPIYSDLVEVKASK